MNLPIDIRDLMSSGTKMREERERPVRIAVFVDVEAPDELVEAIRDAMLPQTGNAMLHVEACAPGEALIIDPTTDAVVALAGPGKTLERSLAASREKFVPTVVVALGEPATAVAHRLGQPLLDTLAADNTDEIVSALGKWLTDRIASKRLALATNFTFIRRAAAEEAIRNTAFQNGVIGFVAIIPGADMPLMTANQGKMLMQIAAVYGQPLGAERIKELAVIVGGGFTLRAIARQLLDFIPGFGWAVKAGIGYTGTLAMGYAALEYFEEGGDFSGVANRVREARDHAVEAARQRVGLGMPAEEPIPAQAYVVVDQEPPAHPALALAPEAPAAPAAGTGVEGAGAQ